MDLNRIVFIGRTFEEYMKMFALDRSEILGKRILDCPSGACSFTAAANRLGADVTGSDLVYYHKPSDLKRKGLADIQHVEESLEKHRGGFVWEYFKSIDELQDARLSALHQCTEDMVQNPGRYVPAVLPNLPFADGEFDVVLSAHFLFMYGDRLDLDFHLSTLKEFLRVSREEIRVFPLVDLSGNRYEYLEDVKRELLNCGCTVEEVSVPYEFQRNANSMLKILKKRQIS